MIRAIINYEVTKISSMEENSRMKVKNVNEIENDKINGKRTDESLYFPNRYSEISLFKHTHISCEVQVVLTSYLF